MSNPSPFRLALRDLPFSARLALAVFLASVGFGYLSALVNLHFAEASPGEVLPTKDDVVTAYAGKSKVSQLERLLVAHPDLPFNGQGSMRSVFTHRRFTDGAWKRLMKVKAKDLELDYEDADQRKRLHEAVERDLEGERQVFLAWIRGGLSEESYTQDRFPLTGKLADLAISRRFVEEDDEKKGERYVRLKSLINTRCARCHGENKSIPGSDYPLETYQQIKDYADPEKPSGKSLAKLSLTTHVHLLGFSMLYGMTGLVLALTSWPGVVRVWLAPLPLVAQLLDIACWWLARTPEPYGPMFAGAIPITGTVVATGLGLQIVLGLLDLFGRTGKIVIGLALAVFVVGGVGFMYKVIDPYLAKEKVAVTSED